MTDTPPLRHSPVLWISVFCFLGYLFIIFFYSLQFGEDTLLPSFVCVGCAERREKGPAVGRKGQREGIC
jgi:hypothetical protein